MTDYRDPNYRDPTYRDPTMPGYRDPVVPANASSWSTSTWGWIAGLSVVVLILIFAFGMSGNNDQTAKDTTNPPATTGQNTVPPASPTPNVKDQAPSMNPAPEVPKK